MYGCLLFFITKKYQQYLYSSFKYEYYMNITAWVFLWKRSKPLIGFEPMTYALPWRYSTTELKGLVDSITEWVTKGIR